MPRNPKKRKALPPPYGTKAFVHQLDLGQKIETPVTQWGIEDPRTVKKSKGPRNPEKSRGPLFGLDANALAAQLDLGREIKMPDTQWKIVDYRTVEKSGSYVYIFVVEVAPETYVEVITLPYESGATVFSRAQRQSEKPMLSNPVAYFENPARPGGWKLEFKNPVSGKWQTVRASFRVRLDAECLKREYKMRYPQYSFRVTPGLRLLQGGRTVDLGPLSRYVANPIW